MVIDFMSILQNLVFVVDITLLKRTLTVTMPAVGVSYHTYDNRDK